MYGLSKFELAYEDKSIRSDTLLVPDFKLRSSRTQPRRSPVLGRSDPNPSHLFWRSAPPGISFMNIMIAKFYLTLADLAAVCDKMFWSKVGPKYYGLGDDSNKYGYQK